MELSSVVSSGLVDCWRGEWLDCIMEGLKLGSSPSS